jgi:hypothetical protein
MSLSAWITSIAVGIVLFGGFALCVRIAIRKGREKRDQAEHGPSDPQ